jgi:NAD(P)-dependent dehydrogenase (short-subunit alcohol dehydrogenase family)
VECKIKSNNKAAGKKYAIVTGASSSIGFQTSLLLARNGFYTYATVPNIDRSEQLADVVKKENLPMEVLPLDVTIETSVRHTVDRIIKESRKVDVLVNNAGYGLIGALEDIPMGEIKTL